MCIDNQVGKINPGMIGMVTVCTTISTWRIGIIYFWPVQNKIERGKCSVRIAHYPTEVIQVETGLFVKSVLLDMHTRCQKVEPLPEVGMYAVLRVAHPQGKGYIRVCPAICILTPNRCNVFGNII